MDDPNRDTNTGFTARLNPSLLSGMWHPVLYPELPLIPFHALSHGLSYTTFSYTDLKVGKSTFAPSSSSPDIKTPISFTLTNTGSLPGSEATQLYISFPSTSDLTHPPLQLRAFKKVHNLGPGESKVVELELDKYAVSYWNERLERWTVEKGKFGVWVGASSANLGLEGTLEVEKAFEWNGL